MHAVFIGASKGIGYNTVLNLLATGQWTATLLLRKPELSEKDPKFKEYLEKGSLNFVKGNATSVDDIAKLFTRDVDVVVTSVGESASTHTWTKLIQGAGPKFSWKGISLDQPTVCTDSTVALIDVLSTLPKVPRVIAVSSMGMGDNHQYMPLALRIMYPWLLNAPHKDKEGLEYLLQRASKTLTAPEAHFPQKWIISPSKVAESKENFIPEIIIARPALLLGGDSPATGKYKANPTLYCYSVNRADVGKFIAEECMPGNDKWVNKLPVIGY